jgi:translation initiation factor IF-1
MSKADCLEISGVVKESLKGGKFLVELENGKNVICTPCGKIKMNKIRIIEGDKVTVELSPYDLNNGRISWRSI